MTEENVKAELIDSLIGAMPTPTPPAPPPIPSVDLGPDGKPQMNKRGRVRNRRGRPSKARTAPPPAAGPAIPGEIIDALPDDAQDAAGAAAAGQLDAAAITCALAWESVGLLALGEAGKFEGEIERDHITATIRAYLAAKGITDVPPGVALTIAAVGYVGARLHRPTVAERLRFALAWTRQKLGI